VGIDRNKIINQFTAFVKENTWDRWCKCCILMVVVKSILYSSGSRFSKLQENEKKKHSQEEGANTHSNANPNMHGGSSK